MGCCFSSAGSYPFLIPPESSKLLHYNISLDGHQTLTMVRCDWDEEVVIVECRNGVWESVNTADVCREDNIIIDDTSHTPG